MFKLSNAQRCGNNTTCNVIYHETIDQYCPSQQFSPLALICGLTYTSKFNNALIHWIDLQRSKNLVFCTKRCTFQIHWCAKLTFNVAWHAALCSFESEFKCHDSRLLCTFPSAAACLNLCSIKMFFVILFSVKATYIGNL